jgi:hypothetical protein
MPEVDTTGVDGGCVPSASLLNHFERLIHAHDMPCCGQIGQMFNDHSGSEAHFQHAVGWLDFKEFARPHAGIKIRARHDDAAHPPQESLRTTERVHQNAPPDLKRCKQHVHAHFSSKSVGSNKPSPK